MANNLLIAAVLLIAVASAGTMTAPPRNRTDSSPRKIASNSDSPSPPSSENPSPPPRQKIASTRTPASNSDSPPPSRNASSASPPPSRNASASSPPSRNAAASSPPPSRNAPASSTPPSRNGSAPNPPPVKAKARGPTNCSDDLVALSKCLPYISIHPNNETDFPPRQCCGDVSSAYLSGSAVCFCYLVRNPGLFGFPLNKTRILSLSDLCPIRTHGTRVKFSLQALCSGSINLPPLSIGKVPDHQRPHTSGIASPPAPPSLVDDYLVPPPSGEDFTQDDTSDDSESPEDTVQVFPAWRSFDINNSSAVPAWVSRSWWLSAMLLLVFYPTGSM